MSARAGRTRPSTTAAARSASPGTSWVAPAPSARTSTFRPGRRPGPVAGQLRSACADDGDVVGGGVRAGVARPQQHRQRLPGPVGAVVDERAQRVEPEPALERRRRACSFSECAVTRVASMSMTSGRSASMPWSGACSPASPHTRARAAARAVSIAASAAVASAASASIVRDTVGSEATGRTRRARRAAPRRRPGSPRPTPAPPPDPARPSPGRAPPAACATAPTPPTAPRPDRPRRSVSVSSTATGLRHHPRAGRVDPDAG